MQLGCLQQTQVLVHQLVLALVGAGTSSDTKGASMYSLTGLELMQMSESGRYLVKPLCQADQLMSEIAVSHAA